MSVFMKQPQISHSLSLSSWFFIQAQHNPKYETDDGDDTSSCDDSHTNFHEPSYNAHLLLA
jgi:hypothetical protein